LIFNTSNYFSHQLTQTSSFLPTILLRKNSAIKVTIEQTFRDYIIIYLPGIAGVAVSAPQGVASNLMRRGVAGACVLYHESLTADILVMASIWSSMAGYFVLHNPQNRLISVLSLSCHCGLLIMISLRPRTDRSYGPSKMPRRDTLILGEKYLLTPRPWKVE
jgi:hypothetical protein